MIYSGTKNDHVMGGAGDYLFIFGAGDGADYFLGGYGWTDSAQLDGVDCTETESGIERNPGVITLDDGNELIFNSVEKLEW